MSNMKSSRHGGLLIECRREYHTEMGKQWSPGLIKPIRLRTLHQKTMQIVLDKLRSSSFGALTKDQEIVLLEDMQVQFEGYRMRNDMKLNSEQRLGVTPAIGICFGTACSCVAVCYHGDVITVPNQSQAGNKTTPSYVAFDLNGEVVGEPAKQHANKNPENTIYDIKRIIGRKMSNSVLQEFKRIWPFKLTEHEGLLKTLINGQLLSPEQVLSKLLSYLRTMTEAYLKLELGTITKAVISVPVSFNERQRKAIMDAARLAGLEVLAMLDEPAAAALAYSWKAHDREPNKKVLVYGLDGNEFEVTVLDVRLREIEVLGVGGNDIFGTEESCCREKFEINDKDLEGTIEIIERVLERANVRKEEIDDIVLVGGSSKDRIVQERLRRFFGGKGLCNAIDPCHCVAYGAAVKAALVNAEQSKERIGFSRIKDVTPASLGIRNKRGEVDKIIKKNTPIPFKINVNRCTVVDNQTSTLIMIYQGEETMAEENKLFGEFILDGIPPAPAGEILVKVSMEINDMGILHVRALCETSGSRNGIQCGGIFTCPS